MAVGLTLVATTAEGHTFSAPAGWHLRFMVNITMMPVRMFVDSATVNRLGAATGVPSRKPRETVSMCLYRG